MFEKVVELLKEQLDMETMEISPDSSFKEDLGVDSLDLFELVMALEDKFGVEIPPEDLEQLNTVGDVAEYLKNKGVEE
ncbi:MAG: acyl carrier protein [Lachnospiraceae bacterium]|nr:acyl carrier protein [Lachnospiraceae bacterium]